MGMEEHAASQGYNEYLSLQIYLTRSIQMRNRNYYSCHWIELLSIEADQ